MKTIEHCLWKWKKNYTSLFYDAYW